jgi:hypothetical protein
LFLVLLFFTFTFKDWKKVFWLLSIFGISYFLAFVLSFTYILSPKIGVIKFAVLFVLFFTAAIKIITCKCKINQGVSFLLAIVFGLFNGLGFSSVFKSEIGRNESTILPILEATFGIFTSLFLLSLGLLVVFTLLKRILKTTKSNYIFIFPVLVALLSLKMMISEVLNQ